MGIFVYQSILVGEFGPTMSEVWDELDTDEEEEERLEEEEIEDFGDED